MIGIRAILENQVTGTGKRSASLHGLRARESRREYDLSRP